MPRPRLNSQYINYIKPFGCGRGMPRPYIYG